MNEMKTCKILEAHVIVAFASLHSPRFGPGSMYGSHGSNSVGDRSSLFIVECHIMIYAIYSSMHVCKLLNNMVA